MQASAPLFAALLALVLRPQRARHRAAARRAARRLRRGRAARRRRSRAATACSRRSRSSVAALCYALAALYSGQRLRGVRRSSSRSARRSRPRSSRCPPRSLQLPTSMPGWKEWASVVALGVLGTGIGVPPLLRPDRRSRRLARDPRHLPRAADGARLRRADPRRAGDRDLARRASR